jgi:hypothetical protein
MGRRRRVSGLTVVLTVGYAAAGLYGLNALRSFTHVDVGVGGLPDRAVLTSAALIVRTVSFQVDPADHMDRVRVELDGARVPAAATRTEGSTVQWRPGPLGEGAHEVTVSVPRPGMGDYRFHRRFTVDDTAPTVEVPALTDAVDICSAVTGRGQAEPGWDAPGRSRCTSTSRRTSRCSWWPPTSPGTRPARRSSRRSGTRAARACT